METRRDILDEELAGNPVTLDGGVSVQHLGKTPETSCALRLLQSFAWANSKKESLSSHIKKNRKFSEAECQSMPPDEVDLFCFIGWLMYEGKMNADSFTQYLSDVRRFCDNMNLRPLPPTPYESQLVANELKAATRLESEFSVKKI